MLTNDSMGSLWLGVTGPNTSMLMTSGQVHTVSSPQMYCTEYCKNPAFMFVTDRMNQHAMAVCWGYELAVSMLLCGNWGFKTASTKHWWPHCNCKGNVTYNEQNIVLSQLNYAHVLLSSDTALKITRQVMYVQQNIGACLCYHGCWEKAVSINIISLCLYYCLGYVICKFYIFYAAL